MSTSVRSVPAKVVLPAGGNFDGWCVVAGGGARSILCAYVTSHGNGDARARREINPAALYYWNSATDLCASITTSRGNIPK
jgi:hypothetical protein